MNLTCPPSMAVHVQKVLQGEYDLPYQHPRPVILDIGANIGSFAAWAIQRWPGCFVHCYEPLPANFELLRLNLGNLVGASVSLNNFAIGDPAPLASFSARTTAEKRASSTWASNRVSRSMLRRKRRVSYQTRQILKIDAGRLGDRHPQRD